MKGTVLRAAPESAATSLWVFCSTGLLDVLPDCWHRFVDINAVQPEPVLVADGCSHWPSVRRAAAMPSIRSLAAAFTGFLDIEHLPCVIRERGAASVYPRVVSCANPDTNGLHGFFDVITDDFLTISLGSQTHRTHAIWELLAAWVNAFARTERYPIRFAP